MPENFVIIMIQVLNFPGILEYKNLYHHDGLVIIQNQMVVDFQEEVKQELLGEIGHGL